MNINSIQKQTNGTGIFCTVDGKTYFADQDINSCDVSGEVSSTTVGWVAKSDTVILVDTEDSNDFGLPQYMWYAYVGNISNVTVTDHTVFSGLQPEGILN